MNNSYTFLQGGGTMGQLIRSRDWSQTSFGSPDTWPDSLKSALSICLNSGFPIAIYWGDEFSLLYNDAWSTIPGDKHPWALGRPGKEVWPEIWDGLDAQFKSVLNNGDSIRVPDALLPMQRYGYTEECYFDYSLSPITDINGKVGGIFNAVVETTYRIINERRNHLLHLLMHQLNVPHSFDAGLQQTTLLLNKAEKDIPFCLIYTSVNGAGLRLASSIHIPSETAAPLEWPQAEAAISKGLTIKVTSLPAALQQVQGHWPEPCTEAVIVPLSLGDTKVSGYMVAGISPRKRLDADYQQFIESVGINIGIAINNGYAHEQEQMIVQRIAESENRFRNMMEQAPLAMSVLRGDDLTVSNANAAMLNMLGKSVDIIGLPLLEAVPKIKGQPFEGILYQVYRSGQPYNEASALGYVNRNGGLESGYFNSSYTPLIEDGKITGVLVVANEVTEQVNAQKAVAESEALLRNITSASPASLWMSDEQGKITYVNHTWAEWSGLSFEESLGAGWANAIIKEDRERAVSQFLSDLNAQRYYEVSFRIANRQGDIMWCLATGNPSFDKNGNFLGYIGACTDITEKIRSEQQLALTNKQLQSAVKELEFLTDSIPTIIWTSKPNGELDFINRRWFESNTSGAEDSLGTSWFNNVHPEDRDRVGKAWQESLQTGKQYEIEFRIKRTHDEYRWFLVRALPMRDSNGDIIKWYGTNTDIDDQKMLERQKDSFLGVASHELKTPVTSIKAYAQVLESMFEREGNDQKAGLMRRLNGQIDRLTHLIADLLDVTKINTGRLQFNDDYFDFGSMIEEIVEDMQRITSTHLITKELLFKGEVYGDKDRISQVIINLLSNAIKYSPEAKQVVLSTKTTSNEVQLSVQDFGIGISPDQCSHVFEQFYRVSGSKEHTFPGLGLGLYISSEIIKREGGRIWVESEPGKGSTFCFALPKAEI